MMKNKFIRLLLIFSFCLPIGIGTVVSFSQDVIIKKNTNNDPRIEVISPGGNTFIGNGSGQINTGAGNTSNGNQALYSNTTGYFNSAMGTSALYSNTSGIKNTTTGVNTLVNNTVGSHNTCNGVDALFYNTSGNENTANGWNALVNNTTGIRNTAVGSLALYSVTSITGWANTGVGVEALYNSTISSGNTAIGYHAGGNYNNSYDNTFVGNQADANGAGYHSSTAVGAATTISASNQVRIGTAATSIGGPQNWTNTSDGRIKNNIREDVPGLDFIKQLRPVTYTKSLQQEMDIMGVIISRELPADNPYEKIRYSGFIAQEVEEAAEVIGYEFSGVDAPKNENDLYGLRYAEFVVPLVKAVQEQQVQINDLKKEMELLKEQNLLLAQLLREKN